MSGPLLALQVCHLSPSRLLDLFGLAHLRCRSLNERFIPYLLHRWVEGCRKGGVLYQELKKRGYAGSARMVYKYLQGVRTTSFPSSRSTGSEPTPSLLDGVTPRHIVRWLLQPVAAREGRTKEVLARVGQANSEIAQTQLLVEEFLLLVRTLQGSDLEPWLERVRTTGTKELQQFAHGLERDKAAVVAGLTLPYRLDLWKGTSIASSSSKDKPMAERGFRTYNTASCLLPKQYGRVRKNL